MKEKLKKTMEKMLNEEHIVTICMDCHAIRINNGEWVGEQTMKDHNIHSHYMEVKSRLDLSHGYCIECAEVEKKKVLDYFQNKANKYSK